MSGHSKWHNIQKKKGLVDAQRAKHFAKFVKAITIAAREGGDPEFNFSLRMAIENAKAGNLPKDKIQAAIKRGSGETGGSIMEEVIYEGFAPGGTAIIIQCLTDNRNRTVAEVRHTVSKGSGNLGNSGSVMWMFDKKGVVIVTDASLVEDRDTFELELIDAGAEDLEWMDTGFQVICSVRDLKTLLDRVEFNGLKPDSSGIEYLAKEDIKINNEAKEKLEKLIDSLEENDDVDSVFTNAEV